MYTHVKTDHIYPGFHWGDYTESEVAAMSEQDRAIMAHLVTQGIYVHSTESEVRNDIESARDTAPEVESDQEANESQTTGGRSASVKRRSSDRT